MIGLDTWIPEIWDIEGGVEDMKKWTLKQSKYFYHPHIGYWTNMIIRLFPNAQRDTLAIVRGKRIQFLDITPEDDDFGDEGEDEDNVGED